MSLSKFLQIYVVPGAVFQSILVGGGYGTGREVVEYFTRFGALGGLLAIGVAFALFLLVICLTFEIGRKFEAYDYRTFFRQLLGPAWPAYEVFAFFLLLLVFAVLVSAAGEVLQDQFGVPIPVGIVIMLALVGTLEYFGRDMVTRVLTFWSAFLYAVFIAFLIAVFSQLSGRIEAAFATAAVESGWAVSGFKYAMYNMTAAPIVLYVARAFETRTQALTSGGIATVIALAPAVIFHVAFLGAYPEVTTAEIPVYDMMGNLGLGVLMIFFTIMLFGTLIETGAGVLQGVNERIDTHRKERNLEPLNKISHAVIAIGLMSLSAVMASFGIVTLIAKGYGTLSWGFFVIYFIPLVTVGIYKLVKTK
jgi:uncharacterized membrane protein YkvI